MKKSLVLGGMLMTLAGCGGGGGDSGATKPDEVIACGVIPKQ